MWLGSRQVLKTGERGDRTVWTVLMGQIGPLFDAGGASAQGARLGGSLVENPFLYQTSEVGLPQEAKEFLC